MTKTKVLVVAQTPPPIHGQSIMTQYFLEGEYSRISLRHLRMAFSSDLKEVGAFKFRKILHVLSIVPKIALERLRFGAKVLYYPPAGPNFIPFLRDCAILISVRWMFSKTVFHFHGNGISDLYARLAWPFRLLFKAAYFRPDVCIRLSPSGPDDAAFLNSRKTAVIPNGIPDFGPGRTREAIAAADTESLRQSPLRILYTGTLSEAKGVLILLEACSILKQRGVPFSCSLAGRADSNLFEREIHSAIERWDLGNEVVLLGQVQGEQKWKAFRDADVFCFPTFYTSEGFPVVLLEAMMSELPVVSTRWRGIPDIVVEGVTGFLVEPKDPKAISDRLADLEANRTLENSMGEAGRRRYLENYTIERFRHRMEDLLAEL